MSKLPYVAGVIATVICVSAAWAEEHNNRHVTQIQVRMQTTGDDKDGDTQVLDTITLKDGRQVASLDCCSAGGQVDTWGAGADQTRPFNHLTPNVTRGELLGATVTIGMRTNGNDTWQFTPTLIVSYDSGAQDTWGFGNTALSSGGGYVSRQFKIPN